MMTLRSNSMALSMALAALSLGSFAAAGASTSVLDAVASKDKEIVQIEGADHYYTERPDLLPKAVETLEAWMTARGF